MLTIEQLIEQQTGIIRMTNGGRLERVSDTELQWVPDQHGSVGLHSGDSWLLVTPSGTILASNTSTTISGATLTADTNYDVYATYNGTVDSFDLDFQEWAGDTARYQDPVRFEGIYVYADNEAGRKKRWLGTIRMDNDTGAKFKDEETLRFVSNYYNCKSARIESIMSGNSWTYNNSAWRRANNDDSTKVEFVVCEPRLLFLEARHNTYKVNVNSNATTGISIDSTDSLHTDCNPISSGWDTGGYAPPAAVCRTAVGAGYHYAYTIESSSESLSVSFTSYSKGYLCGEIMR